MADSFCGENDTFRTGLATLGVGYVLALRPAHAWWAPVGTINSLAEAARAAAWDGPEAPGDWQPVDRAFRDGHTEWWWALDVTVGPYGPDKRRRVVIATTEPATLPDHTTWYLLTNLPAPGVGTATATDLPMADVAEVVRLYGLRIWVEQSDKQVKVALGWNAYQVRKDHAMRRHWALVCCAFSFCSEAASTESARADLAAHGPAPTAAAASPARLPQAGQAHQPVSQFLAALNKLPLGLQWYDLNDLRSGTQYSTVNPARSRISLSGHNPTNAMSRIPHLLFRSYAVRSSYDIC